MNGEGVSEDHPFSKLTDFLTDKIGAKNTRVQNSEQMRKLIRARFLEEQGVEAAGDMAKILSKVFVSTKGEGRKEAVDAMRSTPKIVSQGPSEENRGTNSERE